MSFNGAGTFSITTVGNPVVTGTTISSTWANALTADLATGLSTTVCKDGQTTTTALVPFSNGISISGINAENKKASVYVYTAWDPSDVAGTFTNASSSSSATSTATDYVTVANASGTLTFTCVKPGVYRFTVTGQNEAAAAITFLALRATLGGTGTIYLGTTGTIYPIQEFASSTTQFTGSVTFYASMTAAQTITVLPAVAVTSGGVTTNFTQQCTVSAEYTGTN